MSQQETQDMILKKMAIIFDDPEQNIVNQIKEVNKNRYIQQSTRIEQLKQQLSEFESEIASQNKQITTLEHNVEKEYIKQTKLDAILNEYQQDGKALSEESKKYITTISQLADKVELAKKQCTSAQEKFDAVDKENQQLIKDLDNWNKNVKQIQVDNQKKEQKHLKLIEELAQVKLQSQDTKVVNADDDQQKVLDKLMVDNKRLIKQRQEVVAVFKKQARLIEILKKQKLHLETSVSLDLTEQEFAKMVDFPI